MEEYGLDPTDCKILHLLDLNARTPDSKIAEAVGLTKPAVKYRINNLLAKGIIRNFQLVTNPARFGFEHFKLYLRLENTDISKEKEIIDHLVSEPNSFWVVSCRGSWDILASFYVRNAHHFGKILRRFINLFDTNFLERTICVVEEAPIFTRSYLVPGSKRSQLGYGGEARKAELDSLSYKILKLLAENSRSPLVSIAKGAGSMPQTVRSRIRMMEKEGIILGYRISLDLNKLGFENHIIAFKFRNLDGGTWKDIVSFAKSSGHVIYLPKIMGDHDVDFEIEVRDTQEFDELLYTFRNRFGPVVRGFETARITSEHKMAYFEFNRR
jgi:DNA-binding Lrp family transcriptional regulator